MDKIFNVQLDIKNSTRGGYIEAVQGDTSTILKISIVDNYIPVDLTGLTLKAIINKADNTTVFQDSTNGLLIIDAKNGLAELKLKANSISAIGNARIEIILFEGEDRVTSAIFNFYVRASLDTGNVPISTSEVVTVNEFLTTKDSEIVTRLNTMDANADAKLTQINETLTQTTDTRLTATETKVTNAEVVRENKIVDIENRFNQLTTAQQQASEVVNARTSTIKAKTFPALTDRIEDIEKDIVKPSYSELLTQNTAMFNVGTGKNASNIDVDVSSSVVAGNVDFTIEGETQKNEVVNGNFANGTTGWVGTGASISVMGNIATITGDGVVSNPRLQQTTTIPIVVGKKYYIVAKVKVTNAVSNSIQIAMFGSLTGSSLYANTINSPIQNTLYKPSGLVTIDAGQTGNIIFQIRHTYVDTTTANGKVMEVKEVMCIDLTTKYGAGNEPTQAWCDANLSYLDGIKSVGEDYGGVGIHKIEVLSRSKNLANINAMVKRTDTDIIDISGDSVTITADYYCKIPAIKVKPNTNYYVQAVRSGAGTSGSGGITIYPSGYTTNSILSSTTNYSFNSGNNTLIDMFFYAGTGTVNTKTFTNVMLSEGTTSIPYVPYTEDKINISLKEPLKKVGLSIDKYKEGIVDRYNAQKILNGIENWAIDHNSTVLTNTLAFVCDVLGRKTGTTNLLSDKFNVDNALLTSDVEGIRGYSGATSMTIRILKSKLATQDVAGFKAWLSSNPVTLLYELATPTTETVNIETTKPNEPTGFMPLFCYEKGSVTINSTIPPFFKYTVPLNLKAAVTDNNASIKSIKDYVYKLDSFTTAYLLSLEARLISGGI